MKKVLLALAAFLTSWQGFANNLVVSNFSLTGQNTASKSTMAQFTISWENSWRDNVNYDAAWIFVKYRVAGGSGGDNTWRHATLSTVASQHVAPSGAEIKPSTDGKGVFLYRSSNGGGNVNYANVQVRWNYGSDLKTNVVGNFVGDNDQIEIQVFAIEMVYVPQGAFYLGDATTSNIQGNFEDANTGGVFLVTSENAITLGGSTPGSLGNNNASGMNTADDFNDATSKVLPAAFPKGFKAFFCMKYETTQAQIVDYLNNITLSQANALIPGNFGQWGQGITGTNPNCSTATPWLPATFLTNFASMSYLDWSGLRPMTELEFEKACRGDQSTVANEYAWGTNYVNSTSSITNSGTSTEGGPTGFNVINQGVGRPSRVGMFATSTSTREKAGASYYGILDLSGNMGERVIGVGASTNRAYTGTHGDGLLNINGNATNSDWPGYDGSSVSSNSVQNHRGGTWNIVTATHLTYLRVSDRRYANISGSGIIDDVNCRGVRTAP